MKKMCGRIVRRGCVPKRPLHNLLISLFAGLLLLLAPVTPADAAEGSDWQHALEVTQTLRSSHPATPVVLLLGGSCAREATVSDRDWSADLRRAGDSPIVAYNLGSRNQTFEQEVALVKALPKIPMLIFVGVNRGRFTSAPVKGTVSTTPAPTKGTHNQHHYSHTRIKPLESKQELVSYWMRTRYPVFSERHSANLGRLDELIRLCKERGFRPVILELPRNMEVIGDASTRRSACIRKAALQSPADTQCLSSTSSMRLD